VQVTVFVLDASAILRFIDKEAGWNRVAAILTAKMDQTVEIAISAVQWGEVAGAVRKKLGLPGQERALGILARFQPQIVTVSGERAVRAAALKVDRKIAYADAFALELAMESPDHVLVTADYGFKPVEDLARIEFLPAK
jgi:predicted nucleic acid-binding protein